MYDAAETPVSDLIQWAEQTKHYLRLAQQDLRKANIDPENWADARAFWFANAISTLHATELW